MLAKSKAVKVIITGNLAFEKMWWEKRAIIHHFNFVKD